MSPLSEKEREEVEMLMPWYVNGTLDRESSERVEAALRDDPSLAHSLELLIEDRDVTLAAAEADEMPASMEARFLAQLDAAAAAGTSREAAAAQPGFLGRFGLWLGGLAASATPRGLALAAAAAALLVVLQAGMIVSMIGSEPGAGFRTASGESGQGGPAALVRFAPDAGMAAVAAYLDENGARIVDGPLPGGLFKLRFRESDERSGEQIAATLREQTEFFQLALPSQ